MRATPLDEPGNIGWQRVGVGADEQMDMIGLNRQLNHRPVVFCRYLPDNLFQTIAHEANQHLAPPLGTPDDVVHNQVYAVLLMLIVHVDIIQYGNIVCKARGPFIPWLKPRGFLAHPPVNLGKRNNQAFVFIPHARFIAMLTYKAALVGIQVVTIEESHTSKCSFLDLEPIGHHDRYLGKRVQRGLFLASTGQTIHADINASLNIMRRFAPEVAANGVSAFALHPIPLRLPDRRQDRCKQRPSRKAMA